MAEHVALWGRDIDDDSSPPPDNGSVHNGHHDPITEPIPVYSGYADSASYELDDGYDGNPPPPPPPPAQDASVYRPQYPSSSGGSGSEAPKPEIGVTRAPISVAPKPVTPPTSAEVGKHGHNGTGW